jgi:pimeloyl-ACP methyl ester carboxylesterase
MSTEQSITVDGTEVLLQGRGDQVILMLHGWPDTRALWDDTVLALKADHVCARLTLPGFTRGPASAVSLEEMNQFLRRVINRISPGKPVTLMLHDWGCAFGYEFAIRHPERVARVVAVDVGDHNSPRLQRSWSMREKFSVFAYQYWLAIAWKIGRIFSPGLGNHMTRAMARWLRCPTNPDSINYRMNYPYAMQWFGAAAGFKRAAPVHLPMPMLYVYGARKPFMFHSPEWLEALAAREGCAVEGLPCGHWVMVSQPEAFQARVRAWLGSSD